MSGLVSALDRVKGSFCPYVNQLISFNNVLISNFDFFCNIFETFPCEDLKMRVDIDLLDEIFSSKLKKITKT